jgi:hypothetical protein
MRLKLIIASLLVTIFVASCKHEPMAVLDETFYNESIDPSLIAYKGGVELEGKAPSPHGNFVLKLNSIANSVLDQNGKVPDGVSFPNGSLIVKEVIEKGELTLYASMKKDSTNSFAGENWIWGEYKPDGEVYYSVSRKGSGCTGCHGSSPNSDLTKVFDLH